MLDLKRLAYFSIMLLGISLPVLCGGCENHHKPNHVSVATRELPDVQAAPQSPIQWFISMSNGTEGANVSTAYLFALDSSVIKPAARPGLLSILSEIKSHTGPVFIYGYTDGLGTAQYNLGLSQRRADAIRTWLIDNHVQASRINAQGKGEASSAIDPSQRRVEILLK